MKMDHTVICQFHFICKKSWADLQPIEGALNIRFCLTCSSPVFLTKSYEDLAENVALKRCVAIFLQNPLGGIVELMGDIGYIDNIIQLDPILTRPIEELDIPLQICGLLRKHNITLIGDLVIRTEKQLREVYGINDIQMVEILESFSCRGLTTDMKIDEWIERSMKYRQRRMELDQTGDQKKRVI